MATGLTDPARQVREAARPVLATLARGSRQINADDVDELESQVVVKVLARLAGGGEIEYLDRYSKQVACNAFYDRVRRRRVVEVLETKQGSDDAHDAVPWLERMAEAASASPSDQVIRREDARRHREHIAWALDQLTVAERSILLLRHDKGLDGRQIAELLGYKDARVVDTLAARARSRLMQYLSPSLQAWVKGN